MPFSSATLYVPKGCKQAYASANYWKDFGTITEMDFSIKGDVNEDDVLNVSDVTSIINYLLGTETLPDFTKADLNDDFEINVSDVTALINLILAQWVWARQGEQRCVSEAGAVNSSDDVEEIYRSIMKSSDDKVMVIKGFYEVGRKVYIAVNIADEE